MAMSKGEPPSPIPSLFFIGRNSCGNWVIQDQRGLRGGLFLDRGEALKFAKSENGGKPPTLIMVSGVLELEMGGESGSVRRATGHAPTGLSLVA